MSIEDKRQKWREYYHKRDKAKLREYRKRYEDKKKWNKWRAEYKKKKMQDPEYRKKYNEKMNEIMTQRYRDKKLSEFVDNFKPLDDYGFWNEEG